MVESGGTFTDLLMDLAKHTMSHNAMPGSYKELLETYGSWKVGSIDVVRVPVTDLIQKAVKAVTSMDKNKMLYHLLAIFQLDNGKEFQYIRIEKHSEIVWDPFDVSKKKPGETLWYFITTKFPSGEVMTFRAHELTLAQLLRKAEDIARTEHRTFFSYEPVEANCQQFIKWIIMAIGMLTPDARKFIVQEDLGKDIHGVKRGLMHAITTVAGGAKRMLESYMPPKKKRKIDKSKGKKKTKGKKKVSFLLH